jgi:hypothetical protein
VAASSGATVVAAPDASAAGASILARLSLLASPIEGAVLIPIRVRGKLHGMIEVGRRTAFRATEIASLEALVDALAQKLSHAS